MTDDAPPPWMLWPFFCTFAPFCPLFFWLGVRQWREFARFVAAGTRVEGTVIERKVSRTSDSEGTWEVVRITVQYRDQDGRVYTTRNRGTGRGVRVGETTPVIYNTRAPEEARLEIDRPIAFFIAGAAFTAVSLAALVGALVLSFA